jgi:hypothetical protein
MYQNKLTKTLIRHCEVATEAIDTGATQATEAIYCRELRDETGISKKGFSFPLSVLRFAQPHLQIASEAKCIAIIRGFSRASS